MINYQLQNELDEESCTVDFTQKKVFEADDHVIIDVSQIDLVIKELKLIRKECKEAGIL